MGFDLSTLDGGVKKQEDGLPVEIKHPATDEPLGITIWVACYESERVMARARAIGNKVKQERAKKPHKIGKIEQDEENMRHLAIAAIVKWDGILVDDKPLPLNDDNAAMVLSKYRFIQDAIEEFGGDRANFFKG
jgi:hypothetical protein